MRALVLVGCLVACSSADEPAAPKAAKPPKPKVERRVAAIGDTSKLEPALQRAFDPHGFEPRGTPQPGDWMYEHREDEQSYADYVKSKPNVPYPGRNTIYLLPLGDFPKDAPALESMSKIVKAYFTLDVKLLPAIPLADVTATRRINGSSKKEQILAPDVLEWLEKRLPTDAFAMMAVTMEDLYPEPTWNFVFGMASFEDRVGVQSFARQDPAFFDEKRPANWQNTALRRATWTIVHELSHQFGIHHCQYYRCVIAGSNNQDEADKSPLHACPVDMRKLYFALTQFNGDVDLAAREKKLAATLRELGIADEAEWSEQRAAWISGH